MTETVQFTTPVGRMVQGDLYKPQTTDPDGNPLLIKHGPNVGQPRVDYFVAVAIPKGPEQSWTQTEWGQKIYSVGQKGFPNGQYTAPTFAWKVADGDSQIPNRAGKKPCDRVGYPRHWVLSFSGGYAPKIFNANGTAAITEVGAVKPGYYVQVAATVRGNESMQQPGVFLNHSMVSLAGYGEEILFGPDPTTVGFGQSPLPPGASAVPVSSFTTPASGASAAPVYMPPAATVVPPTAAVVPNPAFLQVPGAPPPPPVPSVRVLTAKAGGATYEQMVAGGWTDTLLVQHGYMLP